MPHLSPIAAPEMKHKDNFVPPVFLWTGAGEAQWPVSQELVLQHTTRSPDLFWRREVLRKVFEDLALNNVWIPHQIAVYWALQPIDNFNLDQGKFMSFNCDDSMPVEIETWVRCPINVRAGQAECVLATNRHSFYQDPTLDLISWLILIRKITD